MNILIVYNKYLYYGGEDTYFTLVCELLKKNGHAVFIYTEDSKTIRNSLWKKIGASIRMFYNFSLHNKLDRLIAHKKIDVALVLNIYPLIGNSIYWHLKRRGIKIIQRIANYRHLCPKTSLFRDGKICEKCPLSNSLVPSVLYGCYHESRIASLIFALSFSLHKAIKSFAHIDAYMFPSSFTARKYIDNGAVPEDKAFIIPTFFDEGEYTTKMSKDKKGIIYAGRLVQEKGVLDLLSIAGKIPTVPITIVGEGSLKDIVIQATQNNKNITYIPFLPKAQLLAQISRHRALVLPSLWYDVLPNIIIESYFMNTPVIAPRIGPFSHMVKNKKTGILYTYKNNSSLIKAITYIMKSKINYSRYCEEERKKYKSKEHYDVLHALLK